MSSHEMGRARWGVTALTAALAVSAATPLVHARTGACAPVSIASEVAGPWRAALEALARATAQEGLPWSCPGGSVELVPDPAGGAELTIRDGRGRAITRKVAAPDEVVPTGEALLAVPLDEGQPVAPPPPPEVGEPPPPPPVFPPARIGPADARAQIQLLIGPRVSGPDAIAWGSALGRLQLPLGPWFLGFWVRYDAHLAGPRGHWEHFETSAVSGALSVGRRVVSGPFELRVTLDPSIAVVMMESGHEDEPHPEGAKPAFRLGTSVLGLFPISGAFRGVVGLDGEFAPAGIGGFRNIDTHNNPPQLPPVPVYTAGLLLGVEASIR